jgi:hypothetical protein
MPDLLPENRLCREPNRIIVIGAGTFTSDMATEATNVARSVMPKITGYLSTTLRPIYGVGWFGIYFPDRRVWFLEQGTRPFTMRSLQGKTIPMWVDDPTGTERRANPKAKVRITVDGRTQVQIFRRVGVKGAARGAKVTTGAYGLRVARYPGAPGRITRREASAPLTTAGRTGGRIAKGNVGVAWRNPGLDARFFLNMAMTSVAAEHGIDADAVYLADEATFYTLVRL